MFEDVHGRQFLASPVSNKEGWTKEERRDIALGLAEFLTTWGVKPKIAIFAGTRHDTYARRKEVREGVTGTLNKTYEDAEWIVEQVSNEGFEAANMTIDLDKAIDEGYNVLVPVNGMVGNQVFRMLFADGGKILAAPCLSVSRPYEDNSRNEKDYAAHVRWLAAMINSKK